MITRKEFLEGKCSLYEYYIQFSFKLLEILVRNSIGLERIINSKDENFNDIPLSDFDKNYEAICNVTRFAIMEKLINVGEFRKTNEVISKAFSVCLQKAIAEKIRMEHKKQL